MDLDIRLIGVLETFTFHIPGFPRPEATIADYEIYVRNIERDVINKLYELQTSTELAIQADSLGRRISVSEWIEWVGDHSEDLHARKIDISLGNGAVSFEELNTVTDQLTRSLLQTRHSTPYPTTPLASITFPSSTVDHRSQRPISPPHTEVIVISDQEDDDDDDGGWLFDYITHPRSVPPWDPDTDEEEMVILPTIFPPRRRRLTPGTQQTVCVERGVVILPSQSPPGRAIQSTSSAENDSLMNLPTPRRILTPRRSQSGITQDEAMATPNVSNTRRSPDTGTDASRARGGGGFSEGMMVAMRGAIEVMSTLMAEAGQDAIPGTSSRDIGRASIGYPSLPSNFLDLTKPVYDNPEDEEPVQLIFRNIYLGDTERDLYSEDIVQQECSCKETCLENCENRASMVECNKRPGHDNCGNTTIQDGNFARTYIRETPDKGRGVFAAEHIPRGRVIGEYTGEVLSLLAYSERPKQTYGVYLTPTTVIDAGQKGGPTRFVNHSCSPNACLVQWFIGGYDRIAVIALQDIPAGKEITLNYRFRTFAGNTKIKCLCGSSRCTGDI